MTDDAVSASAKGATFMVLLQIGSRAVTFALNQILLRFLSPQLLGVAVQLELYIISTLYFSRECLRIATQRRSDGGVQAAINLSYLAVAAGLPIGALLAQMYLSTSHADVPYLTTALRINESTIMVELLSEPGFVAVQQKMLYKTRAAAEASAVVMKTLATASLVFWSRYRSIDLGVLPFAAGELAYSSTLTVVYLWQTSSLARSTGFSLSPRKMESSASLYLQTGIKWLLTEGDKLLVSAFATLEDQGMYAVSANYGGLIARMLFRPIEDSCRNLFANLCATPNDQDQANKNKKEKGEKTANNIRRAADILHNVLRVYGIASLLAFAIGPTAAPLLLQLVAGSRWTDSGAGEVLATYCYCIPLLAINGVSEAFVSATASTKELQKQSIWMGAFSAGFALSAYIFLRVLEMGAKGLVLANCVNMALRIIFNLSFATEFFRRNDVEFKLLELLPNVFAVGRPLPSDGDDSDSKRIRSNDGSPAPPPPANGASMSDLERKKQDAAARMAAVKAKLAASKPNGSTASPAPPAMAAATPPTPPPAAPAAAPPSNDVEARKAEAARKIAEMKAKMAAKRGGGDQQPGSTPTPPMSESQQRVAEAKARAQQIAAQARDRSRTESPAVPTPPPRQDTGRTARGGLGIGLHPSLMGDLNAPSTTVGKGPRGPKFSTTKGNQQLEAPKINPYLADADNEEATRFDDNIYDPSLAVSKGGGRKTKQLVFNEKGKFMAQANALRQQARLEEMKARIAAETRKTEIEEASDRSFLVPAPPEVEWWDEGLVNSDGSEKIDAEDSIITALVQHPVILQAPQEKFQPAPKPLMLTPIEQKKLRRQRRMADMKEEQAKIRLGLVEPPPPKVKKSNMMRVLGEQAVKDPTAVEARVNREIAQRATDHEKANKDRQLSKEQRVEKLKTQQAADEGKGVKIAIFRVDNLSSGKHRYQIDINAKQNALTGMVVLHPEMNLIIVEGGSHSINNYKKLLLNRVKWSENTLPLSNNTSTPTTFAGNNDGTSKGASGESNKASQWLSPLNADGSLKDLGENQCQLVWEGEEGQRMFKKWGSKACETDGEAKEVLRRQKMENMWTLARSMGEQQQQQFF
ncbi:Rft-1-domain-containing protein [Hortaea werneckii]|nr:Rft-1-domain-containing protein [Hortaea werneckii]KAI6910691.1 Rft-1-domain-containing protein [Hortaea werneckii]KAI6926414.1 Rft-1-domain-containing protein [Hortaea werneckii]KAI6960206.1 Rft-1-domain-containing protein [Hortaea werneckii]KAI7021003.1 Rft-1-domain-containing protein [Hortaea werneckii]